MSSPFLKRWTRKYSPFGPLQKWPNLHYPGVDTMAKLFLVTWSGGKQETVRFEGLRTIIRDLEKGQHIDIERLEDATLR